VLGPFATAAEALAALRPADGSCVAPESRPGLLTETLRAAGAGLGPWDREVARWLAGLDVQAIAPVIGWVSRAGRGPAPCVIVRALADAIAYQTALASGCPECADDAPGGCADHREDAARAAEYERALRCLVTGREAQLWTPAWPRPNWSGAGDARGDTATPQLPGQARTDELAGLFQHSHRPALPNSRPVRRGDCAHSRGAWLNLPARW
jgi:hypothetical protein